MTPRGAHGAGPARSAISGGVEGRSPQRNLSFNGSVSRFSPTKIPLLSGFGCPYAMQLPPDPRKDVTVFLQSGGFARMRIEVRTIPRRRHVVARVPPPGRPSEQAPTGRSCATPFGVRRRRPRSARRPPRCSAGAPHGIQRHSTPRGCPPLARFRCRKRNAGIGGPPQCSI